MLLQFEVEALAEDFAHAADLGGSRGGTVAQGAFDSAALAAGERNQSVAPPGEIVHVKTRVAFAAAQLRARNQFAEVGITGRAFDQQYDTRAGIRIAVAAERQLAADDPRESPFPRPPGEADHTVEPVAIGQRERGQP